MRFQPVFCAALLALVGTAAAPAARASVLPFQPQVEKLDNGLRVVMVKYPSPGLVAYYSLVRVGSRDEAEKGVTGFAHFFEHMMFRGTKDWTPERVQELLKQAGADQNGFTTDDFTCYTFFGSAAQLDQLVQYEADRFQNLSYSVDVFKTESQAVLGEYNKSSSSPSLPMREKQREKVFTKHTYGHTTLGYLADIEDMPNQYEYSRKFFDRFYTPDNTTLVVVGDFEPARLMELVRKHYSGWNKKRAKSAIKAQPPQSKPVVEHIDWKTPTLPMLSVSWRTPATDYSSKDTAVYNLIGELLWGRISPLYTELVLEQQKVVSLGDWSWNHRDPYLVHLMATLKDPADFPVLESRLDQAIAEIAAGKLEPKFLEDVKAHVRYAQLLGLNTPAEVALQLAYTMGPTGEPDALEKLLSTVATVTVKDVQSFAKKYLSKKNRSIVSMAQAAAPAKAQ